MKRYSIYNVWLNMVGRCYNQKSNSYHRYGAKGILVCNEWKNDFHVFKSWALNNGYMIGLQLDRIVNSGNYEPANCRFVSIKINNRNRSDNIIVLYNNRNMTVVEASEYSGIKADTIYKRLKNGWDIEKVFIKPILGRNQYK